MAQSTVPEDPADVDQLRAAGREIRALMREAAEAGARLVLVPRGRARLPGQARGRRAAGRVHEVGRLEPRRWAVLREEAVAVAALAGELALWTVFGSLHPLTAPNRPHNDLYVVSDQGRLVARYDKRFLSNTELSYLYTRAPTR
ncbi:hypothetical protein [Kitasatospora sp. NBC_00315]|uniref:hypothetical protein n=1 Tax=Kitasatospora sp. NBC_00315 TaxID=2975963 RepID=UPI0032433445